MEVLLKLVAIDGDKRHNGTSISGSSFGDVNERKSSKSPNTTLTKGIVKISACGETKKKCLCCTVRTHTHRRPFICSN